MRTTKGTFSEMMTPRERRNDNVHRVVLGEVNRYGQHYKRHDGSHINLGKGVRVGELILEERLIPMGISQGVLSQAMNVPGAALAAVMEGRERMTAAMSTRLGRALGDPDTFWLDAEKACQFENLRQVGRKITEEVRPVKEVLAKVGNHPEYRAPRGSTGGESRRAVRKRLLAQCGQGKGDNGRGAGAGAPEWDEDSDRQPPHLAREAHAGARRLRERRGNASARVRRRSAR